MESTSLLLRLQQFITTYYTGTAFQDLCLSLGINSGSLLGERQTDKVYSLIVESVQREKLSLLLERLKTDYRYELSQSQIEHTPRTIALIEGQLYSSQRHNTAASSYLDERVKHRFARSNDSRKRLIAWLAVIIVIVGLVLSVTSQSPSLFTSATPTPEMAGTEPNPPILSVLTLLAQILISFFALTAAIVQITGWDVQTIFTPQSDDDTVEKFPFFVIDNHSALMEQLFPNVSAPVIPDRHIPYSPRIAKELDSAFSEFGRVLLRGRSKTGKTREATELLKRWAHANPTILLARRHVKLNPPFDIPEGLPQDNLVLFFDDIDSYCQDKEAIRNLNDTINYFSHVCRHSSDLKVVATVRQEHEFWVKLHFESISEWSDFHLVDLPPLSSSDTAQFLVAMADHYTLQIDDSTIGEISRKNDGTFLNVILSMRHWLLDGLTSITQVQAEQFASNLTTAWRKRYALLERRYPEVRAIYATVNLLQEIDLPLRIPLVASLASEMNAIPLYQSVDSIFHQIAYCINSSKFMNWYRNHHRRRVYLLTIAATLFAAVYAGIYAFLRFVSINNQAQFFNALGGQVWVQMLFASPLLILLSFLVVLLAMQWNQRRNLHKVSTVLVNLTASDIAIDSEQLRPYDGQFEGMGRPRHWSVSLFKGEDIAGKFTQAIRVKLARVYWKQAQMLLDSGELSAAKNLIAIVIRLLPKDPTPFFVSGEIDLSQGNYQRAAEFYQHSTVLSRGQQHIASKIRLDLCKHRYLQTLQEAESISEQADTEIQEQPSITTAPTFEESTITPTLAHVHQSSISTVFFSLGQLQLSEISSGNRVAADGMNLNEPYKEPQFRPKNSQNHIQQRVSIGFALLVLLLGIWGVTVITPELWRLSEDDPRAGIRLHSFLLSVFPHSPLLLFDRGISHQKIGERDLALENYNQAIVLAPDEASPYSWRASLYREMGEYELALADHNQAIVLAQDEVWPYSERASLYQETGEYDLALADYNQVIALTPDEAFPYLRRASLYQEMGEYDLALADYNQMIALTPDEAFPYLRRANLYQETGEYDLALADYNQVITLAPDETWRYSHRASLYREMSAYDLALADYNQVIALGPDEAGHYSIRASLYREMGEYDLALADYNQAIALGPDVDWHYSLRAGLYREMGEYDLALADYNQAIALGPNEAWAYSDETWAYSDRASLYQEMGEHDLALAEYDRLSSVRPYDQTAFFGRASVYREQGAYESALAEYEKASQLNPYNRDVFLARATLYREMGEYELALAEYDSLSTVRPYEQTPFLGRANVYREQGEYESALAEYEKASQLNPYNQDVSLEKAALYQEMGKYELALTEYNRLSTTRPYDQTPFLRRANIYREQSEYESALAEYEKANQLNPYNRDIFLERADLYQVIGEYELALAQYDRLSTVRPYDQIVFLGRANVYREQGEYESALAEYEKANQLNPYNQDVFLKKAALYLEMGEYALALAEYDRLSTVRPYDQTAFFGRASLYREQGEYESALAEYEKASQLNPYHVYTFVGRAEIYQTMGEYDLALSEYQKALLRHPRSVPLLVGRSIIYQKLGNLTAALDDLNVAYTVTQRNPSYRLSLYSVSLSKSEKVAKHELDYVLYERGRLLRILGWLDKALIDLSKAVRLDDQAQFADYLERSIAYRQQADQQSAFADISASIALNAEYGPSFFERAQLFKLQGDEKMVESDLGRALESGFQCVEVCDHHYVKSIMPRFDLIEP